MWLNGGLGVLIATGDQTDGRYAVLESAGVEGFFREGGKPAGSLRLPPADEQFLDKQALKEIASRYDQEFVGRPCRRKIDPLVDDHCNSIEEGLSQLNLSGGLHSVPYS